MAIGTESSSPQTHTLAAPTSGDQVKAARPSGASRWFPMVLRVGSHGLVWITVLVPTVIDLTEGWRPIRDDAMTSIGSYRVFSAQSPLVGGWSLASQGMHHAFFDLGPLLFWLLAIPVHLDPNQGPLWGAALICGAALSAAVEAVWSVKGWPAAAALALVVADVGWRTQMFTDLVWNPHFGLIFLIAAGATAWAVAAGKFGWWPIVVLFGSVAAQCHLVYAVTAVALVVIAPLAAWAYGVRPSRWRWCAVGLFVGAACWVLPLFQEITGHPGNMSLIVDSGGTQARVGLGFGLHVLSTAAAPHPIWLTQFPIVDAFVPNGISHYVDGHSEVWAVLVLALVLGVALVARRTRRELSALAVIALLVAGGTVVSFAAFPRNQLDLVAYLVNVFWAVGMILWIVVVWAAGSLAAAGFRRWRGGPDHLQSRAPIARGLEVAALLLLAVAGVAGVRALVPAAHAQAAEARADAPLDRAIARSIERSVPPGPVIVTVRPSSFGPRYGNYSIDDWGVALVLLEDGWRPGLRDSFFGVATHLSVPPGAHWPEVIVRVNPATKAVIGAQRVDPARPRG